MRPADTSHRELAAPTTRIPTAYAEGAVAWEVVERVPRRVLERVPQPGHLGESLQRVRFLKRGGRRAALRGKFYPSCSSSLRACLRGPAALSHRALAALENVLSPSPPVAWSRCGSRPPPTPPWRPTTDPRRLPWPYFLAARLDFFEVDFFLVPLDGAISTRSLSVPSNRLVVICVTGIGDGSGWAIGRHTAALARLGWVH